MNYQAYLIKQAIDSELFVYGTLKDPKTRQEAVGSTLGSGVKDQLDDHKKVKRDADYPDIAVKAKSQVAGLRLKVTPAQLRKLDAWEKAYNRRKVKLRSGKKTFVYDYRDGDKGRVT